jgi:hypothetical protein
MCRRVDRSETEERHEAVKYKMSRSLRRITSLLTNGSTVSQASKSTRSCVCALSSQSSNRRGVIAFLTPFVVIGYRNAVGHRRLTAGQPCSGRKTRNTEPTARPYGSDNLQTEGRDCASPKHTQSSPSRTRNTNGNNGRWCDGREYAEIKKML